MKTLTDRASKIELLLLDVDGVMTDGRIIMNDLGEEIKFFNVKDGYGLRLLMDSGIKVAIITGRKSKTVEHRARDLGIQEVHQGVKDKASLSIRLLEKFGLNSSQACCIGDDLPDMAMFKCVEMPIAVADATEEVRSAACHVTGKGGGKGAVREVCELILKARGFWPRILSNITEKRK